MSHLSKELLLIISTRIKDYQKKNYFRTLKGRLKREQDIFFVSFCVIKLSLEILNSNSKLIHFGNRFTLNYSLSFILLIKKGLNIKFF